MFTKTVLVASAFAALTAASFAAPATASATPDGTSGCNADVCAALSGTTGDQNVRAWAYDRSFNGHFELKGPNGYDQNSGGDTNWAAGDWRNGAVWGFHNIQSGAYCVIGWEKSGNGYTKIGEPCVDTRG